MGTVILAEPEGRGCMSAAHKTPSIQMFLPPETLKLLRIYQQNLPDELVMEEQMLILFSDMRDFTELVEQYPAQEVYQALHASMMLQAKLIHQFGGSINKFLGDGLLACFSGEHKARRAVRCVQQMMRDLPEQTQLPFRCQVGFGLHSGSVLFGIVGDDMRREFALIGDVVNTAARLCGLASGFQALATDAVWRELPDALRTEYLHPLGEKHFRGKKQVMEVYRVNVVA